jgi:hypothetical protein
VAFAVAIALAGHGWLGPRRTLSSGRRGRRRGRVACWSRHSNALLILAAPELR